MSLGIARATLPAEFQDVTSKQLLMTPLPQFLHARLIMSAVGQKLNTGSLALPLGPTREINGGGASYMGLTEMQYMLSDEIAKQAIRVQPDFSEAARSNGVGHTIRINRPKFASTTYTMASRRLTAGSAISTTPVNAQSEQVPLTVERWGGPYDPAQNAVAPIGINAFDATRAIHSIPAIAELKFQEDFHRTIDSFGVTLFDSVASANIVYAGSMAADNDAKQTDDNPFDYATLLKCQKALDDLNIPTFSNGRRLMILTTKQVQDLMQDDQFQRMSVFNEYNPLLKGAYVKTCCDFDILKSTTLNQVSNSSSVKVQYGQAFGPGMVGVGPAGMPYVSASTQDNYGQDFLAVWLWFCAFGVLDERFGLSVRSS